MNAMDEKPTSRNKEELARRKAEDFRFFLLAHAKGNADIYSLLRDRSIDDAIAAEKAELRLSEGG